MLFFDLPSSLQHFGTILIRFRFFVLHIAWGTWKLIDYKGAPQVEGHKAIASGLDIFTFGGHKLLGRFEGQDVAVHKLLGHARPLLGLLLSCSESGMFLSTYLTLVFSVFLFAASWGVQLKIRELFKSLFAWLQCLFLVSVFLLLISWVMSPQPETSWILA